MQGSIQDSYSWYLRYFGTISGTTSRPYSIATLPQGPLLGVVSPSFSYWDLPALTKNSLWRRRPRLSHTLKAIRAQRDNQGFSWAISTDHPYYWLLIRTLDFAGYEYHNYLCRIEAKFQGYIEVGPKNEYIIQGASAVTTQLFEQKIWSISTGYLS